ncbi:MAG TPA: undecaprenyl diphosphate synthase family protein [Candidatus Woesearchaeota archaeon]|nr:undecaprenyl diphosphate synthase family protein [Candidatus Woesearchaeota archaeon]
MVIFPLNKKSFKLVGVISHLGIITDLERGFRLEGSVDKAVVSVKELCEFCVENDIEFCSLFLFGKVYPEEYEKQKFIREMACLLLNDEFFSNIRISVMGRWAELSEISNDVNALLSKEKKETKLTLSLFLNYSQREEIVDVIRVITKKIELGKISPEEVTRYVVDEHIQPDVPDLSVVLFFNTDGFGDFVGFKLSTAIFGLSEKSFIEVRRQDIFEAIKKTGYALIKH